MSDGHVRSEETTPLRRVGLIPAAGLGSRIRFPFSKELYPVRFRRDTPDGDSRPVAALELLLEQLRNGGAASAFIVIRDGKWDIPRHLSSISHLGLDLAYLIATDSGGVPFSLDTGGGFLDDAVVLMGFPDVLLEPHDAYRPVVDRLEAGVADVVLGLFPPIDPTVNDQVRVDPSGRVIEVAPKPAASAMDYAWAIAAWRPSFTRFLRARTGEMLRAQRTTAHDGREYSVGHALSDAIASGLVIEGAHLEGGAFLDIGTPRGLALALSDGRADPRP